MNYRFSNLLGAPYRGGNLLIHENELLTPVGNRVTQVGRARRQLCGGKLLARGKAAASCAKRIIGAAQLRGIADAWLLHASDMPLMAPRAAGTPSVTLATVPTPLPPFPSGR